jgi:LEA14-like dessication related protein
LIALFFIISIVLTLLLWVRPPDINVGTVNPPTTGSEIQPTNDGVNINLAVDISVQNPNYFAVAFKKIQTDVFYPINNTALGGGTQTDITFHSHSQTNFTFPFTITYLKSLDPNKVILVDIATKCGFIGGTKSQITVNYKITLSLRVLFLTISPAVSNSLSFDCPLTEAEVEALGPGLLGS